MKSLDAQLLRTLRASPVHLLPGDLAAQLGVPLADVEHALAGLVAAGFDIERKPGLGCRLLRSPDRLIADDLHSRLDDCALAREILVFAETSSTNDVALRLGRSGHPGGAAIFAERQTAGRGRFGREWNSADHAGLWFSLLLRPAWPVAEWMRLTTWAGVAVAEVLGAIAPARLKWPNDVLIGGKKVAGILIESATDDAGQLFAVAGIGVNVNQREFPPTLSETAGSLRQFAGEAVDRPALAAALLRELNASLSAVPSDFTRLVDRARNLSSLLGSWVEMHSGQESFQGIAEALDADGQLQIRLASGELRTMTAGEVSTRRPAAPAR